MGTYKISREEFGLFNATSQLRIVRIHGNFVVLRVLNGKVMISIYELSNFWIQVIQAYPERTLIEISPVLNSRNTHQYLGLEPMS